MSLVSYCASDDSDNSDEESSEQTPVVTAHTNAPKTVLSGEISDEDDDYQQASTSAKSSISTAIISKSTKDDIGMNIDLNTNFLHNNLPQPKSSTTSKDMGIDLDDTLEDEVKPKASQMSDAPKPPPKRNKQPVKITIPKLRPDDDEPKEKRLKMESSNEKSGLFSLLPPPMHAAKKESNRPLLPYTLGKKPASKTETNVKPTKTSEDLVSRRKMTPFQAMTGYESDSDDEESSKGNFFSLDSEKDTEVSKTNHKKPSSRLPTSSQILPVLNDTPLPSLASSLPKVTVNPDAPLAFNSDSKNTLFSSYSSLPNVSPIPTVSYEDSHSMSSASNPSVSNSQQYSHYNMPYQYEQYNEYKESQEDQNQSQIQKYLQDEEFLKLQGKKTRGKEEIHIIDAHMDDMMNNDIEVSRTLTEETEYRAHRKKENMPTSKQKRKHQITYLAFQAKERELELKNSWAQGRATKRQTQSKYGF